jgi:hypothetical protein
MRRLFLLALLLPVTSALAQGPDLGVAASLMNGPRATPTRLVGRWLMQDRYASMELVLGRGGELRSFILGDNCTSHECGGVPDLTGSWWTGIRRGHKYLCVLDTSRSTFPDCQEYEYSSSKRGETYLTLGRMGALIRTGPATILSP